MLRKHSDLANHTFSVQGQISAEKQPLPPGPLRGSMVNALQPEVFNSREMIRPLASSHSAFGMWPARVGGEGARRRPSARWVVSLDFGCLWEKLHIVQRRLQ
jgi:hypothetical protein